MDSNQRSHDLHNAHADMKLDASKEADAKVMAAETKVQPLEHELQGTKDESVQMMVGQKMSDDKISESKMTSPNHLVLENDSLVATVKKNLDLNQRAEYPECLEAIRIRNLYGPVPEVPSILLKSKEYNAYRTGCTHGIHSCILDSELSLSRQPNDASGKAKVEGDIAINKDGCLSCSREVHTFELILKAAKSAINTKYRKKKFASSKKIPERLFGKLLETPVVTQSEPTPKFVHQPSEDPTPQKCAKTSTKTSDYNRPIPPREPKTIDATSKICPSLQLFKYTFQRKRKRETVRITDENFSAENKIQEKK